MPRNEVQKPSHDHLCFLAPVTFTAPVLVKPPSPQGNNRGHPALTTG